MTLAEADTRVWRHFMACSDDYLQHHLAHLAHCSDTLNLTNNVLYTLLVTAMHTWLIAVIH